MCSTEFRNEPLIHIDGTAFLYRVTASVMNECNDAFVNNHPFHNLMFHTDFSHHSQQHCIQFLFTLGYDTYTNQQDNPNLMLMLV